MDFLRYKRIRQAYWAFIVGFIVLALRLFFVQLKIGPELAEQAYVQQTHIVDLEEAARGDILDRNKLSFTGNEKVLKVVVFPYLIKDEALMVESLSPILGCSQADILNQIGSKPFILENPITEGQAQKIDRLHLPGVQVHYFKHRYDSNHLAVHLIGHLGKISSSELSKYKDTVKKLDTNRDKRYRKTDLVGKMGLEKFYDIYLKGSRSQQYLSVTTDGKDRPIRGLGIRYYTERDPARKHLVLTIDKKIQEVVEEVLEQKQVANGAVVVMDVGSGDILAMASRPVFNPDDVDSFLEDGAIGNVFLDNSIQLVQPGSVFKPVIAAAALEEGLLTADSRFLCLGEDDNLVTCYREEGHGLINFAEAMAYSCNPVFARVGRAVGAEKIIEYADKLGFADQGIIGYHIQPDSRQDLSLLKKPYTIVNTSLGQGPVLVTPVQITAMMGTFARDGEYKKPRLVMEMVDSSFKTEKVFASDPGKQVISTETCRIIQEMLKDVTHFGTGTLAYIPEWGSAGKTGSAQVNKSQGIVDAWFTGYSPVDNPQYVVTVLIKGGDSGGGTAAPVFKEITKRILELE